MLITLVAGVVVLSGGAWLGGRCSPDPSAERTYLLRSGSAWCEPWVGRLLDACPWAFAACGVSFIGAALWLAWRESRDWKTRPEPSPPA